MTLPAQLNVQPPYCITICHEILKLKLAGGQISPPIMHLLHVLHESKIKTDKLPKPVGNKFYKHYINVGLLSCNAVWACKQTPAFCGNSLQCTERHNSTLLHNGGMYLKVHILLQHKNQQ
jgi:hypothetical protein